MSRARWRRATAILCCAVCAGCGDGLVDRSGAAEQPRTLVLANSDGSLDGAPAVAQFVRRVEELSGGRLRIDVRSDRDDTHDEVATIEDVRAGEAALGWAGTRAFDQVGVDAFRPLHVPLLVGSYAAQAAVVSDRLSDDLLGALEPVGLQGLAITAGQLRVPAAQERPVLTAEDFAGLRFRTSASDAQTDALRALGADPGRTDVVTDVGAFDAVETMLWTYSAAGQYGPMPFLTANLALWPRTVVLFADTDAMATLDDDERTWLQHAAAEAAEWSTEHAGDRDTEQLERACRFGARVATASPEQLATVRAAAKPLVRDLRQDPELGAVLARVEQLVADAPADPVPALPEGCAYQPGDRAGVPPTVEALTGPGDPGALPQGVYRVELTRELLAQAGLTPEDVANNAGIWTWTLREGSWRYEFEPADPASKGAEMSTCEGWYAVRDNAASFTTNTRYLGGTCAPPTWAARWSAAGDRLRWSANTIPDFGVPFAGDGWIKID